MIRYTGSLHNILNDAVSQNLRAAAVGMSLTFPSGQIL
jgi:hypothetical protein